MTNNAAIYGPPAHTPTVFTTFLSREDDGSWTISLHASSPTHKGVLWSLPKVTNVPEQDYHHLVVGQVLGQLMGDMVRDLPGTIERARFVAGGGLYEQLPLW